MAHLPIPDELFAGPHGRARRRMVRHDLWDRDIRDVRVLAAMARVPRHEFVRPGLAAMAYEDHPLEIGFGQTISQPYIVAKMSELAEVRQGSRVLEIGTGSGYQAAVLLELGARVLGIEILAPLAETARATLRRLGYERARIIQGDGAAGLAAEAPFDAILLTAAPERLPRRLLEQLAPGGRLVAPIGPLENQILYVFTRRGEGFERQPCLGVRFVPLTGALQHESPASD
jgi:protein-L-isoaspartate(D-aspartate) O-methyltransferase